VMHQLSRGAAGGCTGSVKHELGAFCRRRLE
jgi:hypothetical protein